MGWAVGFDSRYDRDIGYGVPATCDHPGCGERIDRGLSYVCGGDAYGGDEGCGLFFCGRHMFVGAKRPQLCLRCRNGHAEPYPPTPDTDTWVLHKLIDGSWSAWRESNPDAVDRLRVLARAILATHPHSQWRSTER